MSEILNISVTKGKTTLPINTADPSEGGDLPANVYAEALALGLKVLLNRGMDKINKELYPNEDERKAAATKKAEENLARLREGKIKASRAKGAGKVPGAVMTRARYLARQVVKDEMKRVGMKVSHTKSSEITKAANDLLATEDGAQFVTQAEAEFKQAQETKLTSVSDIVSGIKTDPALVAAAEAKKKSQQLSAKQAGKVQKHKPGL